MYPYIKTKHNKILIIILLSLILTHCKKNKPLQVDVETYHKTIDKITSIIVHDVFSPPVASRIYAHSTFIGYEVLHVNDTQQKHTKKITWYKGIPKPQNKKHINLNMAAIIAMSEIGKKLIFSEKKMIQYQDSLYHIWEQDPYFNETKEYATQVVKTYMKYVKNDNYLQTRTMPKYTVNPNNPAVWQPTPPAYMAAVEPHWNKIRPWLLDSAAQFKPTPMIAFSNKKNSPFYQLANAVYIEGNKIKKSNETNNTPLKIAKFWDCNPYITVQQGHVMFATKKITPGGHWIGITKILCKDKHLDIYKSAYAYMRVSIVMEDAFISCWDEKYRSNVIRPETYINKYIDENWKPILQTPPFPEYTSGHSVVSGAISTVLTSIFGDKISFKDTSEEPYGLPTRTFSSINQAAEEAAISRFYGGIHYKPAIEKGLKQGREIGQLHNKYYK